MSDHQTLHLLACGHVDDGKSTLIGRMLYDIGVVPEDQIKGAFVDGAINFSHLTDGLEDERAQGITIDVAYRYFRHANRYFRIADTPGHIEYTRNMAVAAANSDCALILIDAHHGVRKQTINHSHIAAMFGINHFVIVINKMDKTNFSEERFHEIKKSYTDSLGEKARELNLTFIPVCALLGDNVVQKSQNTPWYTGPTLIEYLQELQIDSVSTNGASLPIQSVVCISDTMRGYQGTLIGGHIKVGEKLAIAGNDLTVNVSALYHSGHEVRHVAPGNAITLVTDKNYDLSRGDVFYALDAPVVCAEKFTGNILWLEPILEHQNIIRCIIKIHNREERAKIHVRRSQSEILEAIIHVASSIPVDLYSRHKQTGMFLAIDPESEKVLGVGTITATNVMCTN